MVESSAGKKLSQTRLAKRLTIDEVAHATKLRPDKILALENDDFSRFGSIAYGKGFLQIYARYLGIDITEQLRTLEIPDNTVSISDYQYLNSPQPSAPRQRDRSLERGGARRERRPPSVLPLLFVLGIGALCVFGYSKMTAPRQPAAPVRSAPPGPVEAAAPVPVPPSPSESVEEKGKPSNHQAPSLLHPGRLSADAAFLANVNPPPSAPPPARVETEETGVVNELIVEPLRKTWVKIRKNSPDSPVIFEDYLYPGVRPLKLRGARFFVEVRDQGAVQIRKNGQLIAYQAPGISIQ